MSNNPEITETQQQLQDHVDSIAKDINDGIEITKDGDYSHLIDDCNGDDGDYKEGDYLSAVDYTQDVLDIEYIVSRDKSYKSARLLVAFGGPNIWIDLNDEKVKGYWWGDYAEANIYGDFMREIEQWIEELYNC